VEYTDQDRRQYKREWGYWLGGAIILLAVYAFMASRSGNWGWFWPGIPLGIWAVVLIVAPLFGSNSRKQ